MHFWHRSPKLSITGSYLFGGKCDLRIMTNTVSRKPNNTCAVIINVLCIMATVELLITEMWSQRQSSRAWEPNLANSHRGGMCSLMCQTMKQIQAGKCSPVLGVTTHPHSLGCIPKLDELDVPGTAWRWEGESLGLIPRTKMVMFLWNLITRELAAKQAYSAQ